MTRGSEWTHVCVVQVTRQVAQCKCAKRFQVEQIGENKYRVGSAQLLIHIYYRE